MSRPDHDPVNHPSHYTGHPSGVECITITEHMGFLLGSAMKYIWRCDLKKDAIEDLKKARWYLDREIVNREKAAVNATASAGLAALTPTGIAEKYKELAVDEALRYLKVDEHQKRAIPRFYENDEERSARLKATPATELAEKLKAWEDQRAGQGVLDLTAKATS